MSDLHTALTNAIKDWEASTNAPPTSNGQDKPSHLFKPTTHVTRETFNFVRDNPGLGMKAIVQAMEARGFKRSSISSLLSKLTRETLFMKDANGGYHATRSEFVHIKRPKKIKRPRGPHKKAKPVAMPVVKTEAPKPAPSGFSAESFVENLTLREARTLYEFLRTMFSGV